MSLSVVSNSRAIFARLAGTQRAPTIFATTVRPAQPSAHSLGDKAQVSDVAKAAQAAEAAADVSAAQKYPPGKYDFSHMSRQQLLDVTNDMILNKHVKPEDIKELTDLIGNPRAPDFNTPMNVMQTLADLQKQSRSSGDVSTADRLKTILDWLAAFEPEPINGVEVSRNAAE
jgi:hypothetical protein